MAKGGRPRKISDAEKRLLRQLVEEKPLATLDEITEAFYTHTGLSVHHMTVRKRLDETGIRLPAAQAVSDSLTALAWLQQHNARQVFFKYCSTFDSTIEVEQQKVVITQHRSGLFKNTQLVT